MYSITSLEFGILSKQDIKNLAVCELTNSKLNSKYVENSVYDLRLGTMDSMSNCVTCLLPISECAGHFSFIKFNRHFINPLFRKYVIMLLRCVCHSCGKIIFNADYIKTIINPIGNLTDSKLFGAIHEKAKKVGLCSWCGFIMPAISYDQISDSIKCDEKDLEEKLIVRIFKNLTNSDISSLGFNPDMIRPRDMVTNVFGILPPSARPFILADENVCDDDITARYLEFLRINEHIARGGEDVQKHVDTLKFKIKTFIDNSNNKSKYPKGRPIKSIKQRITGKKSLIRNNIIGKRVEQSGRTVIGPGPSLKLSQVGVPREFATILTFPENVNDHNLKEMEHIVNSGAAEKITTPDGRTLLLKYALYNRGTILMYGDVVVRGKLKVLVSHQNFNQRRYEDKPNQCVGQLGDLKDTDFIERGGKMFNVVPWSRKYITIAPGFIVYRYIRDGDICLINRQPTLHKGSMMAYEIVLHAQKNITFNLASTKSFNADYDGDEINIHIPQSYIAALELRELMMATKQIISSRTGGANITIVQDTLIGAYIMTTDDEFGTPAIFNDIILSTNIEMTKIAGVQRRAQAAGINPFCGRVMLSCILPADFDLTTENVEIAGGFICAGFLTKKEINSCIIPLLHKEYEEEIVIDFIDNLQFVAVKWITEYGYTVDIRDCLPAAGAEIDRVVTECVSEAFLLSKNITSSQLRESNINMCLSRAQNSGMKFAKDALLPDNNLVKSVKSGAKGDYFNIAQVCGIVGQQNIDGARMKCELNHGKRTLPHYHFEEMEENYETRGFIKSSFIRGLNPREFFTHARSGRDGIISTVCSTAGSGYNQRKLSKLLEDIKVHYDYTVRDAVDNVIQFSYGPGSFDPTMVRGEHPFDIDRVIAREKY